MQLRKESGEGLGDFYFLIDSVPELIQRIIPSRTEAGKHVDKEIIYFMKDGG